MERTYEILISITSENDGATFLRKGAEPHTETLSMDEAVQRLGKTKVLDLLGLARKRILEAT